MFEYEIPILHPLVVHFPIAFIFAGATVVVIWAVKPSPFWYRVAALCFAAGVAASLVAYLTGEGAEEAAEDVPIVEELVHTHEDMAIFTLAAAIITLITIIVIRPGIVMGRQDNAKPPTSAIRWTLAGLALAAAVLVAWTSHLGGLMVWGVPR